MRGRYAYPFIGYGNGWTFRVDVYDLPYTNAETADLKPMDPDLFADAD